MKRILLGAVVGGLIVFAWSAVIHIATPLGMAGISALPGEEAVLAALRANVREDGFYFFPAAGMSPDMTEAEHEAWVERMRRGPTGMMVVHPQGAEPMMARQLVLELLSDVLAALLVAFGLAHVLAPYGRRVVLVALAGVFAWLAVSVSYWIWYGFPDVYLCAELVDQVGGWLLAGLAMAKIVRPIIVGHQDQTG
jgi:hypothetical protein